MKKIICFSVFVEPVIAVPLIIIFFIGMCFVSNIFIENIMKSDFGLEVFIEIIFIVFYIAFFFLLYYFLSLKIKVYENKIIYKRFFCFFKKTISKGDIANISIVCNKNINENISLFYRFINFFKKFPRTIPYEYMIIFYRDNKKIYVFPGVYNVERLWYFLGGDRDGVPIWPCPSKEQVKEIKKELICLCIFIIIAMIILNLL